MTSGVLNKLHSRLEKTVQYFLPVGDEKIFLNEKLGKTLAIRFTGKIICKNCGNSTNKSFSQGFCFPCMRKLAACDMCILKPETCHFHQGTCREPEWGLANCFQPHYVYLSNTSGVKVGITRHTQLPTRWIDQGATQALPIFKVSNRQQSGFIEHAFKDLIADKTNWRAILKGDAQDLDLKQRSEELKQALTSKLDKIILKEEVDTIEYLDSEITTIEYPVIEYPTKIISHNFDKKPLVEGTLMGIKGQYLIFDTGVINIRKFTSYEVQVA